MEQMDGLGIYMKVIKLAKATEQINMSYKQTYIANLLIEKKTRLN